ncbi:hypothetical protein [Picosynechococcus sp. NKBG15041c]|uniref:hypothetical protein n=1 Tax=Picosynechococcus sp. NKBG15041c TaxID=1407650 RepID=UPI00046544DA|nr:hypothetical protein [Picosynechococcus sp. NKBG15041c]
MKRRDEIGFMIGFFFLMQELENLLGYIKEMEGSLMISDGERETTSDSKEFALAISASLFQKARQLPSSTKTEILNAMADLARVTPD